MKKKIIICLIILNFIFTITTYSKDKKLILDDITIAIDSGHGGKDIGTSYNNIKEKDINLSISKYLKEELSKYGANIIMTREGDYDLSYPNASLRKKSDFDNRIKLINESNTKLFISIHQNYYEDSKYNGIQVFYKGNKELADYLQNKLNNKRKSYKISNKLYMYNKLNSDGLLIECGFLSNYKDRKKLRNKAYHKELAILIAKNIVEYYKLNNVNS